MVGDALTDWEGAKGVKADFIGIQSGKSSNIFPPTKILLNNFNSLEVIVKPNFYSLEVLIIATLVTNVIFGSYSIPDFLSYTLSQ